MAFKGMRVGVLCLRRNRINVENNAIRITKTSDVLDNNRRMFKFMTQKS